MGGAGSGPPRKPSKKLMKQVLPVEEIFTPEELKMYKDLIDVYMADFEDDDLSAGDFDDIMDLAKNRIMEFRLLKESRGADAVANIMDLAPTLEKIRKQNDKLKENLSARRRDRINPNEFKGFSIVDLAVAFDEQKRERVREQIRKNRLEEDIVIDSRKDYAGNRDDVDAKHKEEDDNI